MDRLDAFDVITDPELTARTTNLKRAFALKLAAQVVREEWYAYEDPRELQKAIRDKTFQPGERLKALLLEFSGAIDAETLHVLRDVGVGAPQVGAIGVGSPVEQRMAQEAPAPAKKPGIFRR